MAGNHWLEAMQELRSTGDASPKPAATRPKQLSRHSLLLFCVVDQILEFEVGARGIRKVLERPVLLVQDVLLGEVRTQRFL